MPKQGFIWNHNILLKLNENTQMISYSLLLIDQVSVIITFNDILCPNKSNLECCDHSTETEI